MEAGLQVINDEGILQIDGNFRNYLLDRKVTLTGRLRDRFPEYGYFYEITAPSGSMVACQPVDGTFVTMYSSQVNGETTLYTFASTVSGALLTSPVCTFYIFSLLITPPSSTCGLEVYDAGGKLVFSSEASYMTPVGIWTGKDYNVVANKYMTGNGGGFYGEILSGVRPRSNHAFVFGGPSGEWSVSSYRASDDALWYFDEDIRACFAGWRGSNFIFATDLVGGRSGRATGPLNHGYGYCQYYLMLIDVTKLI